MHQQYTPLRYPGGKSRLSPYLKEVIKHNDLLDGVYIEPFAGGAGAALTLLIHEYCSRIVINDIDSNVYSFWMSVLTRTNDLTKLILETDINILTWSRCRKIINSREGSELDKAFAFFFLNRTNRSGIQSAGVIGGINQTGKWKIDARFNKESLVDKIIKISKYKNRISVTNEDAVHFLQRIDFNALNRPFVYLDPPYYVKGNRLYTNYYKHEDHVQICKTLSEINAKWITSYDSVEEIITLYRNYKMLFYNLQYSAGKSYKGTEVIIYSDSVSMPNVENPIKMAS